MKSYSKGILVGISIVIGSLLLMGLTTTETEVGRYQISITDGGRNGHNNYIHETIIEKNI